MTKSSELRDAVLKAVKPTAIDRFVSLYSPTRALERQRARGASAMLGFGGFGGYAAGRYDLKSMKGWFTAQGAADDVVLYDLQTIRDRTRDLIRNTPIARGAVNTVVSKVVGTGLTLQARPDAEGLGITDDEAADLADHIEREFSLWADNTECDLTRTQDFYGLTNLFLRSALESGDCFALTPIIPKRVGAVYDLALQLIEADRVVNPVTQLTNTDTLKGGIEYDSNGTPTRYHVRKKHPQSTMGLMDTSDIVYEAFGKETGRRNVIHGFVKERPGQTRGVPYLAPVVELCKQLSRYTNAEVDAAVLSAMFTVFITTPTGDSFSDTIGDTGTVQGMAQGMVNPETEVKLGSGSIVDLMPGEDPKFANPTRPNSQFDPFVQACAEQIGQALGIPYEVLVKHFTASYSAARAALLEAWEYFKWVRAWVIGAFTQPAYETWFDRAVALGRITAPGYFADAATRRAYLRAEWYGPQPVSLDPEKDANAAMTRLEIGVSTLQDETLNLTGKDWQEQETQQVREQNIRKRDGLPPGPGATPVVNGPGQQPNKPNAPDNGGNGPNSPDTTENS